MDNSSEWACYTYQIPIENLLNGCNLFRIMDVDEDLGMEQLSSILND